MAVDYGFGVFTNGAVTRAAVDAADRVYLRADGWRAVSEHELVPPKAGAGSSTEAWAEYAGAQGVTVPEDATRSDIIAALEGAGKPTE